MGIATKSLKVFKRTTISTLLVASFCIFTQDFYVFPGITNSLIFGHENYPPAEVEQLITKAADQQVVYLWRLKPNEIKSKGVVLMYHGNGETLTSFVRMQYWLRSAGYTSYAMEYRGYAGRRGWPSENGFYLDAEVAVDLILKEEGVTAQEIIPFAHSVGTGLAAYTALRYQTNSLVLIAPYLNLKQLVSEMPSVSFPVLKLLAPFLKYSFPTDLYLNKLQHTCIVLAHGENDKIIPFSHAQRLKDKFENTVTLLSYQHAGHVDILDSARDNILKELENCKIKST